MYIRVNSDMFSLINFQLSEYLGRADAMLKKTTVSKQQRNAVSFRMHSKKFLNNRFIVHYIVVCLC